MIPSSVFYAANFEGLNEALWDRNQAVGAKLSLTLDAVTVLRVTTGQDGTGTTIYYDVWSTFRFCSILFLLLLRRSIKPVELLF